MDSATRVKIILKVFSFKFSFSVDVLGSAKGWAASFLFHPKLRAQFQAFVQRTDTFSLGVCNGCQLMSLLGWIDANGRYCFFFFSRMLSVIIDCGGFTQA